MEPIDAQGSGRVRLDKWLWAARFFKTRSLSAEAIGLGRVSVNGQTAKAARYVKIGDEIAIRDGEWTRCVSIKALSGMRGSAPMAALLYEETPESIAKREAQREQRRLSPEPASAYTQGRPTKRDRRDLHNWNERWSANLDD